MNNSPAIFALSALRQFLPFLAKIGPARFRRWVVDWIPSKRIQKVKMSSDVMHDSAQTILKERREQLAKCDLNKIAEDERPRDIISVLRKYRQSNSSRSGSLIDLHSERKREMCPRAENER